MNYNIRLLFEKINNDIQNKTDQEIEIYKNNLLKKIENSEIIIINDEIIINYGSNIKIDLNQIVLLSDLIVLTSINFTIILYKYIYDFIFDKLNIIKINKIIYDLDYNYYDFIYENESSKDEMYNKAFAILESKYPDFDKDNYIICQKYNKELTELFDELASPYHILKIEEEYNYNIESYINYNDIKELLISTDNYIELFDKINQYIHDKIWDYMNEINLNKFNYNNNNKIREVKGIGKAEGSPLISKIFKSFVIYNKIIGDDLEFIINEYIDNGPTIFELYNYNYDNYDYSSKIEEFFENINYRDDEDSNNVYSFLAIKYYMKKGLYSKAYSVFKYIDGNDQISLLKLNEITNWVSNNIILNYIYCLYNLKDDENFNKEFDEEYSFEDYFFEVINIVSSYNYDYFHNNNKNYLCNEDNMSYYHFFAYIYYKEIDIDDNHKNKFLNIFMCSYKNNDELYMNISFLLYLIKNEEIHKDWLLNHLSKIIKNNKYNYEEHFLSQNHLKELADYIFRLGYVSMSLELYKQVNIIGYNQESLDIIIMNSSISDIIFKLGFKHNNILLIKKFCEENSNDLYYYYNLNGGESILYNILLKYCNDYSLTILTYLSYKEMDIKFITLAIKYSFELKKNNITNKLIETFANPNYIEVLILLANIYKKNYELALKYNEQLIDNYYYPAYLNYGIILYENNIHSDKIIKSFYKALLYNSIKLFDNLDVTLQFNIYMIVLAYIHRTCTNNVLINKIYSSKIFNNKIMKNCSKNIVVKNNLDHGNKNVCSNCYEKYDYINNIPVYHNINCSKYNICHNCYINLSNINSEPQCPYQCITKRQKIN